MDQKLSVLVVDDEIAILNISRHFLEHRGFAVTTVDSGDEALTALAAARYDLLICDKNMPGLHGLQVLVLARQLQPHLATMLMTGSPEIVTFDGLQLDGYLEKPWHTAETLANAAMAAINHRARGFGAAAPEREGGERPSLADDQTQRTKS
jgi:CheY-like chemotaxis protein